MQNFEENIHKIIPTNVKNNDEIHYNLLLINGHITTVDSHKCSANKIQVHLGGKYYEFDVIQTNFKCLLELHAGINEITLKFCNFELELNVNFTPKQSKYTVLPLYIVCKNHNGSFQAPNNASNTPEIACAKIACVSRLIQTFYSNKLAELGFSQNTFQFRKTQPICEIFYSDLDVNEARRLSQLDLWTYFAREIMQSHLGDDHVKYLAFLSCTRYRGDEFVANEHVTHEDILSLTDAHVALGGGGLALFGSGCLYTWPKSIEECFACFSDETIIDKRVLMDDSNYRGTYGACFSTTLGAVCHELGHCFDLGHTKNGIMGRGFDNINRVFCLSPQKLRNVSINMHERKLQSFTKLSKLENRYEDFTFFTRNCALILSAHRWFQNVVTNGDLSYCKETAIVKSENGIVLVEIRTIKNEEVVHWWEFSQKRPMTVFRVPKTYYDVPDQIIFIIDSKGVVLKQNLM